MLFRTKYFITLLHMPVFCRFLKMPYYTVIIKRKPLCAAGVTDDWGTVKQVIDAFPNTCAQRFDSNMEAEKYARDRNCEMINIIEYAAMSESGANKNELKRKRDELEIEEQMNQVKSVAKDHIKKVKMSFNALQVAIAPLSGLSPTCAEQIQKLNDKVAFKLNKILKITKTINQENDLSSNKKQAPDESQKSSNESQTTSSLDPETPTTSIILSVDDKELAITTFAYNEKNEVIVYTDGSCTNNGKREASAGAGVWFGMNHSLNMSVKVPGIQTNNRAEIYATIHALERVLATGLTRINIRTDSNFIIKSVNEWVHKWKVNGWRTAGGNEVKNKRLFVVLLNNIESMDSCSWTYVPAHKGITGNEEADKLAKAGAKL